MIFRYFKPYPRFQIDKELGTCSIYFPKSSPLPSVQVSGNGKMLKQLACLEACKQLHEMGALTDNLVPDTVEQADIDAPEIGKKLIWFIKCLEYCIGTDVRSFHLQVATMSF